MILDINAFIGKWPYWPIRSTTPAEVVRELDGWGIDRAAICSTRSLFVNWDDGNCEVESAVGAHPDRLLGFACVSTRELSHEIPAGDYDFDAYARRGFAGIRIYPQHHSYHPLYDGCVDRIAEEAEYRRWPVLLPIRTIMNWGMPMLELAVVEEVVRRHPATLWILAGINYLWELQMAITLMKRFPTVHLETSCIEGFEAIPKLVEQLGPERILFGSGAPLQHGGANVAKVMHAALSDQAREAILSGNARRLLRLA